MEAFSGWQGRHAPVAERKAAEDAGDELARIDPHLEQHRLTVRQFELHSAEASAFLHIVTNDAYSSAWWHPD